MISTELFEIELTKESRQLLRGIPHGSVRWTKTVCNFKKPQKKTNIYKIQKSPLELGKRTLVDYMVT